MIKRKTYPRVSVAGNPSDGFWGKCVSMAFSNYSAECCILPSESFVFQKQDRTELALKDYDNLKEVLWHFFPTKLYKLPLVIEDNKLAFAVVKTFFDFCQLNNIKNDTTPFRMFYGSNIPYSLGFAGSTSLSISILKALNDFYNTNICGVDIETIALHAETHELGRSAGPQDPVAVNREACVYMDFSKQAYRSESVGENFLSLEKAVTHIDYSSSETYLSNAPVRDNRAIRYTTSPLLEIIEAKELPFFIITRGFGSDSSIELSPNVKAYRIGDKRVIEGMKRIACLAEPAKEAIVQRDIKTLGEIIIEGFELPVEYFDNNYLGRINIEFVREAIKEGAYAKFPGSGGAVFGVYPSEAVFQKLKKKFGVKGYKIEKVSTTMAH